MDELKLSARLIASFAFFALFVVVSILNIVFSYLDKLKARAITKPFCMFFLSLSAMLFSPTNWLIYVGALFGMAGDVIYLFKSSKKCIISGALCFYVGHILYLTQIILLMNDKSIISPRFALYAITSFILFFIAFFPIAFLLTGKKKLFSVFGSFYASTILLYLTSAIVCCFNGFGEYMFLVSIGAALFILSDCYLTYGMFNKKVMKKRNFIVMLTYLSAQALIVVGLALSATFLI